MKKIDQILKNGKVTQDLDQTLSTKEIDDLYKDMFGLNFTKDRKQCILFNKVGVLTANVTYLGNPHPIYKKRIQLKDYYPEYAKSNSDKGLKTIFVGIYTYNETRLFVVFEPGTYLKKKSHNSSAHVFSMNLQYAQRAGEFFKTDGFDNKVHIFKPEHFKEYVKSLAGIEPVVSDYEDVIKTIKDYFVSFFSSFQKDWNGIKSYKEMISNGYQNARQNRWPGWYFEYLFRNYLQSHETKDIAWNSNKKKDGIDLDLVFPTKEWVYGDLKADQIDEDILGNNFESFEKVVVQHNGVVYYICALYKAEKDSKHDYVTSKFWNSLRDEDKKYKNDVELQNRAGKQMKYSVKIESINILKIDKNMYEILKENPFNQGRNSDGKPRNPKLKVKKDMISALSVYAMNCQGEQYE